MNKKTFGYLAGSFTAFAFLPQVYEIYKSQSTKDLSIETLLMFFIGQVLWIYYGFSTKDTPIAFFAVITGTLYVYLIYKKVTLDILKKK